MRIIIAKIIATIKNNDALNCPKLADPSYKVETKDPDEGSAAGILLEVVVDILIVRTFNSIHLYIFV